MTWDSGAARDDYCCYFNKWNICVENGSKGTNVPLDYFNTPATLLPYE